MKKTKYILFVIIAFVFFLPLKSNAQNGNEFTIGYNFSVPLPDSKDFISKVSYAGLELRGKRYINPNMSVSMSMAWNVFFEESTELIALKNADVSGKQNRYINTMPMLLGAQYYFGNNKSRPYVGLNTGFLYSNRRLQIGIYEETNYKWRFMMQSEAGYIINLNRSSDVAIGVSYSYAFPSTSDILNKKVSESWVSFKLSYGWRYGL
jgi:outer membrane protein W